MLSDVLEKSSSQVQEIIILRCDRLLTDIPSTLDPASTPTPHLMMVPRIWSALVRSLFQLSEHEIEWKTMQALQKILKKAQWFYGYGSFCSSPLPLPADISPSSDPGSDLLLFTWNDFCSLQLVSGFTFTPVILFLSLSVAVSVVDIPIHESIFADSLPQRWSRWRVRLIFISGPTSLSLRLSLSLLSLFSLVLSSFLESKVKEAVHQRSLVRSGSTQEQY
jgi:hypothetical protein